MIKKALVIAAAFGASPLAAATYIDTATVVTAGTGNGTFGPGGAPGTFDLAAITGRDDRGYALGGQTGVPGQIVVSFSTGSVLDGAGVDLIVYDNFGLSEGLQVEGSTDGVAYTLIGNIASDFSSVCDSTAPCASGLDLAGSGLAFASFFRLTAIPGGCVSNYPECYDLDTLEAVNFQVSGAIPEPATWALMIGGFGMTGAALRRRRSPRVTFV